MSSKKIVVPVIGRLAVQLKLINPQQLAQALKLQEPGSGKRLGAILLEQGMLDERQLSKLLAIQKDLVAKQKAKKAAALASVAPAGAPAPVPVQPAAGSPPLASAAHSTPPAPAVSAAAESPSMPARVLGEASLELQIGDTSDSHRQRLAQLLSDAVQSGASDIHIHAGASPKQRVAGVLEEMSPTAIASEEAEQLVCAALSADERALLARTGEHDFCLDLPGVGRFRANAYRQQRGFDVVFRSIAPEPPSLQSLGLPEELAKYTEYHQGMVLITGPAGCGKSATMAAMVDLINETRHEHILSVEDPIEVVHPSKKCIVNQRAAGRHTGSFARALRGALREDPDIIVIGELRDLETISLAMTAAETGHFVLATLHTNNAVRTINRMIGAFPSGEQPQVRTMLSDSLRAVISQRLVPRADGSGRVPALEILVLNKAISNLVREEKTVQIRSAMQTGRSQGMCLLEQSLNELVQGGVVEREVALRFAEEKKMISEG